MERREMQVQFLESSLTVLAVSCGKQMKTSFGRKTSVAFFAVLN
jgi:hypothetical protein